MYLIKWFGIVMLVSLERLTMNVCYNRTETFELHIFCTLTYFKLQLYFLFFILFNKNLTFIFYSDCTVAYYLPPLGRCCLGIKVRWHRVNDDLNVGILK